MSKVLVVFLSILLVINNIILIYSLPGKSDSDLINFTRNLNKMTKELLSSNKFLESDFKTKIKIVSNKMRDSSQDSLELPSYEYAKTLIEFQRNFPQKGQLEESLTELFGYIERIDALHKHYKLYEIPKLIGGAKSPYHESTIDDFLQVLTSHGAGGTQDILDKIYHIMVPSASDTMRLGLFELMVEQRKASHPRDLCGLENSFFQQLNEIYDILFHIEIMAYVAMAYSYIFLSHKHESPFKSETEKVAIAFARRNIQYLSLVQSAMRNASREIYQCDPPKHIRNETFVEFSHLFQKIFVNEIQVLPSETCSISCKEINSNKIFRCYSWKSLSKLNTYCPKRYCRGIMRDCSWVGSSTLCEFPSEFPRRYQWIDSANGQYAPREKCQGKEIRVDHSMSDFYFFNFRVVTGVRFVLKNRMIHIQIQQGQLIKDGEINSTTTEWVELENFKYVDSENAFYKLDQSGPLLMEEGIDYSFIGSKQNILFIDDIIGPLETLVTGVRLNHSFPQWPGEVNTSPIQIEVFISHYIYEAGKLDLDSFPSMWVTTQNMPNPPIWYNRDRAEIKLTMPDDPTKSFDNYPNTESNQYIEFRETDIWKDAGQTTIPLFDIQPVTSSVRPLDGIGLIHRNSNNNGGFISLKIFTVNCTLHIRVIDKSDTQYHKSAFNHYLNNALKFYETYN
ncbi:uncharacterized protein LOC130670285 isoform X2 [Microplitis mediator]|uniref:uncharacterized protein LOC130670285 isoform X2 n=1 Tax=Microplitis mediator TaxID=375433 RepID=UPI0025575F45|nr:uncharacterized protein LOC130670285 isoform X2 [Microplitis mediator]